MTPAVKVNSVDPLNQYKQLAGQPGAVARKDGDVAAALGKAKKKVEGEFVFPYPSHARWKR